MMTPEEREKYDQLAHDVRTVIVAAHRQGATMLLYERCLDAIERLIGLAREEPARSDCPTCNNEGGGLSEHGNWISCGDCGFPPCPPELSQQPPRASAPVFQNPWSESGQAHFWITHRGPDACDVNHLLECPMPMLPPPRPSSASACMAQEWMKRHAKHNTSGDSREHCPRAYRVDAHCECGLDTALAGPRCAAATAEVHREVAPGDPRPGEEWEVSEGWEPVGQATVDGRCVTASLSVAGIPLRIDRGDFVVVYRRRAPQSKGDER